jgi:hypothetical protein
MSYLKTPAAADQLGITYHRLIGLIRFRKIIRPERDSSGDYLWADADLERARQALAVMHAPKPAAARGSLRRRIARLEQNVPARAAQKHNPSLTAAKFLTTP